VSSGFFLFLARFCVELIAMNMTQFSILIDFACSNCIVSFLVLWCS
jgi:hypothetical protein